MKELTYRPHIFIAILGIQPQVITLTLDLLAKRRLKWDEICIIHTDETFNPHAKKARTMHQAVKQLDKEFSLRKASPSPRPGEKLWPATYRYDPFQHTFMYRRIRIQQQAARQPGQPYQPQPVGDIETEESIRATFQTIYQTVREYKDQRAIIHFGLAGGRKSMAMFGMAAAQLLFEPGDALWHIVSEPTFEKTQKMHDDGHQTHLVPIPFISLTRIAPVLGQLIASSDPFDAIQAQDDFLQLIDLRRKEQFVRQLDYDEYQILIGITQGLANQDIGRRLDKPLKKGTVANKLTTIYETYLTSLNVRREEISEPSKERIRTFLATEFAAYFQQRGASI